MTPLTVLTVTGTISGGKITGTWSDNFEGHSRSGNWLTTSGSATAIPCSNVGTPFITVTQPITEPDSGVNGNWANDTLTENAIAWVGTDGTTFCAKGTTTDGTFVTTGPKSPEAGVALSAGITGTFTGNETWVLPAGTATTTSVSSLTLATDTSAVTSQFNNWQSSVFTQSAGASTYSFTYVVDGDSSDTWTDAGTGDSGDITNPPAADTVYVNGTTGSDSNVGSQNAPFKTIQAAVNAVTAGGTIDVAAGTYNETVNISKALTLEGAQTGVVGSNHSGGESTVNGMNVTASNVTVDGFTFANAGTQVNVTGASTLSGDVVENSIFSGYKSVGLVTDDAGNFDVAGNLFENPAASTEAMQIKDHSGTGGCSGTTVSGNTFTASTNNGGADVNFSCTMGNTSTNVTVSNNAETGNTGGTSFAAFSGISGALRISNNNITGSTGSALYFWGGITGTTTISQNIITDGSGNAISIQNDPTNGGPNTGGTFSIAHNTLSGNNRSLKIGGDANDPLAAGTSVSLNSNDISGDTTDAVEDNSTSSVAVDATQDFWGDASGPIVGTDIKGSDDASVSFSPWWTTSGMTTLGYATSTSGSNTTTTTGSSSTTLSGDSSQGGSVAVTATIPAGTTITGNSSWDGTLDPPTATTEIVTISGENTTVTSAVTIGSSESDLTFSSPVMLTFAGEAGQHVGFFNKAGTFAEITDTCDTNATSTTIDGGTTFATGGACKIDSGSNLVVYTEHFSTFVTFTETAVVSSGGGGGGGGGGGNGPIVGGGSGGSTAVALPNNGGSAPSGNGTVTTTTTGTGGQVLGASAYNFGTNFGYGARGEDVTQLQTILIADGYLDISAPTGWFGPLTKAAVEKYQKMNGIVQTGFVGVLTRGVLNQGVTPSSSDELQSLEQELQTLEAQISALGGTTSTTTTQ